MTLTANRLRELLSYDEQTGIFRRRTATGPRWRPNAIAGCLDRSVGYVRVTVDGRIYLAHRLAFLYVFGRWPFPEIDHINGERTDNRIANLRECDRTRNGSNLKRKDNNTSGVPGVSFCSDRGKWETYINPRRKRIFLGYFDNFEDAVRARRAAETRHFGEFRRTGN